MMDVTVMERAGLDGLMELLHEVGLKSFDSVPFEPRGMYRVAVEGSYRAEVKTSVVVDFGGPMCHWVTKTIFVAIEVNKKGQCFLSL